MKMLKAIIIWLLLAAIPVQGLAANAMVICKASHHVKHHRHAVEAHTHHQHDHGYQPPAADAAAQSDDDSKASDSQLSKCSACAAACAGTLWATVEKNSWLVLAAGSDCISYVAFHIPGVDPDPPEHPPRFSLV